jgi:hypothetical protein
LDLILLKKYEDDITNHLLQECHYPEENIIRPNNFKIDENKNFLINYKHIYLIGSTCNIVKNVSFSEVENTCCILISGSIRHIPEKYFSCFNKLDQFMLLLKSNNYLKNYFIVAFLKRKYI